MFPIQQRCFPAMMEKRDVIARSVTGSGKTLAFVLPIAQKLMAARSKGSVTPSARPPVLILEPTRELVRQTCLVVTRLAPTLRCEMFFGGRVHLNSPPVSIQLMSVALTNAKGWAGGLGVVNRSWIMVLIGTYGA